MPSSYERATVTYLDANARTVNSAQPGGYLTATWYDSTSNVIRELGAGNRQRALDASTSDTPAAEAQLAAALSDVSVYSADGQQLLETFGPEHDVVLPNSGTTVRGRAHTRNTYDEGAPDTGGPFGLVTTERVSVSHVSAGQTVDDDVRTTTAKYDGELRAETATTVDPDGMDMTTRTGYDAAGRVTTSTSPAGGGADTTPSTRVTVYYTGSANSTHPECGGRPEWAGLACRVRAGGAVESGPELVAKVFTYNMNGQSRTEAETNTGGVRRTVSQTFDGAGRRSSPPLGRQTSYTDADGNTSTFACNVLGELATTTDGKATRTYTYDEGGERRGLATSVNDGQAGVFTVRYDADGSPVAELRQERPDRSGK